MKPRIHFHFEKTSLQRTDRLQRFDSHQSTCNIPPWRVDNSRNSDQVQRSHGGEGAPISAATDVDPVSSHRDSDRASDNIRLQPTPETHTHKAHSHYFQLLTQQIDSPLLRTSGDGLMQRDTGTPRGPEAPSPSPCGRFCQASLKRSSKLSAPRCGMVFGLL